jgi:hypothetical protein
LRENGERKYASYPGLCARILQDNSEQPSRSSYLTTWTLLPGGETPSIRIEINSLIVLLPDLLVLPLQIPPDDPHHNNNTQREPAAGTHRLRVPRSIRLGPQIRRVDASDITDGIRQRDRDGLLLVGLPTGRGDPGKRDVVDAVCRADEERHGEVACACVQSCA